MVAKVFPKLGILPDKCAVSVPPQSEPHSVTTSISAETPLLPYTTRNTPVRTPGFTTPQTPHIPPTNVVGHPGMYVQDLEEIAPAPPSLASKSSTDHLKLDRSTCGPSNIDRFVPGLPGPSGYLAQAYLANLIEDGVSNT